MSKVIKKIANILLHTFAGVVLVAILLILGVAMALSLPRVQTLLAGAATEWLNEKCNVEVSVGALSLENISSLAAEDVYVADLAGDTLLWVGKLKGKIDRTALLEEGKFLPSDIVAKDVKLYIHEGKTGRNNIYSLVRHIKGFFPATTSSGERFAINNVRAERFRFKLYNERLAGRTPKSAIDYSDMDMMIASAEFQQIAIEGKDVIFSGITDITVEDKSGAELHNSSLGELRVGHALLDFKQIDFLSGGSRLTLPYLILSADDWLDYKPFCDLVTLNLELKNTTIEPHSAGKWVYELGYYGLQGEEICGTYYGTVNDFVADITGRLYGSEVAVVGSVQHITKPADITADIDLRYDSTPENTAYLYNQVVHAPLPEEAMEWLGKFDTLNLEAKAQALPHKVSTTATLTTNLGGVDIVGSLGYGKPAVSFDGDIRALALDLGEVLGVEKLGKVDAQLNGEVSIDGGTISGTAQAHIDNIGWGGNTLSGIDLNATIADGVLSGTISSLDADALLYAEGSGTLGSEEEGEYDLNLNIERLNFKALGVGSAERAGWMAGNVEAKLSGSSLDNMVGRAMINNLTYASATDTLSTELVNISLAGGQSDKSFSLYSPIADVKYRSAASYASVLNYLTKVMPSQLPDGRSNDTATTQESTTRYGDRLYAADDHSAITVTIKEGERLAAVLLPGANIAPDSRLTMEFAPSAEEFALLVESDYLALSDMVVSRLRVSGNGSGKEITLEAECDELLAMGTAIPDVSITATTKGNNTATASLYFSNSDTSLSGHLEAVAHLSRTENDRLKVAANIENSYLTAPLNRWEIAAKEIDYSPDGISIGEFEAESDNGGLFVAGEIAKSSRQPLTLSLRNVALDEWVGLLAGYNQLSGVADGEIRLYSALAKPYGEGVLTLSSLSAGGIQIDDMEVSVEMPKGKTKALVELSNRLHNRTLAKGVYDYSTGSYDASVSVEEVDLSLLNPMLTNVASDIEGTGRIDLALTGLKNRLNIGGKVALDNFGARIGFTGAHYNIPGAVVTFENNEGTIAPLRIEDGEGGWAEAEGYINLKDLGNIGYGVSLIPHNLVAIDLPDGENRAFYGKVYASGGARLTSEGGKTEISGAINTGSGSVFSLPLTGNSEFAGADFVTFVNSSEQNEATTSSLVSRKKNELKEHKRTGGGTSIGIMLGVDTGTLLRLIIDPATENVIEARGVADLGVTLDDRKDEFAIRGDYEIAEGVYNFNFQNLITKKFTINPNSFIRWNGSPLDATIDVGATYKLKTSLAPLLGGESTASRASTPVECIVNLTGSLASVDVSFDINVPNANTEYQSILSSYFSSQEMMATQFVYLLTLGNFYSDSSSGQPNTASAAGTAIGLEFLAGQVSRLVSNDAYKFNLKYKTIDDTSSSYSIDFETEIIDDRLLLELEANVDTGQYYQLSGNSNQLSGGGALTLLLDHSGDFYLKGFSRTIDRFDENQGLQENGVGLYYKRSFNRFADLWRKKKSNSRGDSEKSDNFATTNQEDTTQNENNKKE